MPPHMYTESSSSTTDYDTTTHNSHDITTTTARRMEEQQQQYHSEEQLWGAIEIIPNRLYYAPLKYFPAEEHRDDDHEDIGRGSTSPPSSATTTKKKKNIHYFSIDSELIYWNFFLDFGPLNLGQLYRFSSKLNAKLSSPQYKDSIICYYSGAKGEQRANATYLICAWSMLYLGRSLEEAYYGFQDFGGSEEQSSKGGGGVVWKQPGENVSLPPPPPPPRSNSGGEKRVTLASVSSSPFVNLHPLPPFHDASPIVCTYDLTVYDCLRGLDRAREFGFFKFGNTPPLQQPQRRMQQQQKKHQHQQHQRMKKQRRSSGGSNSSDNSDVVEGDPPQQQQQYGLGSGNPTTFNVDEYEYFEQVENGDLNWIIQNKILAVAGPQNQKIITPEGFCMLTPQDYIPYFHKTNVKLVVRLNKKCYDENEFVMRGSIMWNIIIWMGVVPKRVFCMQY
jgi:hypothetical protein